MSLQATKAQDPDPQRTTLDKSHLRGGRLPENRAGGQLPLKRASFLPALKSLKIHLLRQSNIDRQSDTNLILQGLH